MKISTIQLLFAALCVLLVPPLVGTAIALFCAAPVLLFWIPSSYGAAWFEAHDIPVILTAPAAIAVPIWLFGFSWLPLWAALKLLDRAYRKPKKTLDIVCWIP